MGLNPENTTFVSSRNPTFLNGCYMRWLGQIQMSTFWLSRNVRFLSLQSAFEVLPL
jgi:hypothetical protein